MTPEELKEVEERWKPGTILPETSIYDYLGHCASDVITLLAHIRELEVYVMAGKLMEKLSGTLDIINVGGFPKANWWWAHRTFESVRIEKGFDSWESAVRDAYKKLMKEDTE